MSAREPLPPLRRRIRGRYDRFLAAIAADPGRAAEIAVTAAVLVLGSALVFATLHPSYLWRNTTPTGGDTQAHVWGPRYLLDHLLPQFRLSGWTPDWYDGFPAYRFYMVVPSLMIVALNVGLQWYVAVPVVVALFLLPLAGWTRRRLYRYRWVLFATAVIGTIIVVPVAYNRSFKIVTALGLLTLPAACWAFAKLADLPFPIPPLAVGSGLLFVYNREPLFNNTGNIIGGNFQSTMAGEFAFSISLTFAVLYLGVAIRGLRTGKYRATAAVLFALAGLCHLIPAFFVLGCTFFLLVVHPSIARAKWMLTMVPVAGLLTAFWVLPFYLNSPFVNDMGWERLPVANAAVNDYGYYLIPASLRWVLAMALIGVVLSAVRRYSAGLVLGLAWATVTVAFVAMPQARLWNARLLPFLYLSTTLLAAIGLGELIRLAGALANGRPDRPYRPITVPATLFSLAGVFLFVALPINGMFIGIIDRSPTADGSKTKASLLGLSTTQSNPVYGWTGGNYSGLEAKQALPVGCDLPTSKTPCTSGGWPEYRDLVATMADLGENPDHGCGRAFWEYDKTVLDGYGSPMAPMLLPYWTDGCIGSQEGLYFESSATVPFHFLMQSELSAAPSSPQRGLPYPGFDMKAGVRHLQLLGVKYYLAASDTAVAAASRNPDLTEVARSGTWHIYKVADADVVTPMPYEPVVASGISDTQKGWVPTTSAWFLRGDLDVPLAAEGPANWKRVAADPIPEDWRLLTAWTRQQLGADNVMDPLPELPRTPLPKNKVSNVDLGNHTVSFDVARPGVPVLVKVSYFPNWEVSGAKGPYRVTPNLMVVIPTGTHVTLSYGRSTIELGSEALSLVGVAGVVALSLAAPITMPPEQPNRASQWLDRLIIGRPDADEDDDEPDDDAGAGGDTGPPEPDGPATAEPDDDDDIFVADAPRPD